MSTTVTFSGSMTLTALISAALSGDVQGNQQGSIPQQIITFNPSTTQPIVTGYLTASALTMTATSYLLAASSAPFGSYSPGFVPGTTNKIKLLIVQNLSATVTVTLEQGASNGCTLIGTGAAVLVPPLGFAVIYDPTGSNSGALTTGSNDKLTIAVSGAGATCNILVVYGT